MCVLSIFVMKKETKERNLWDPVMEKRVVSQKDLWNREMKFTKEDDSSSPVTQEFSHWIVSIYPRSKNSDGCKNLNFLTPNSEFSPKSLDRGASDDYPSVGPSTGIGKKGGGKGNTNSGKKEVESSRR
jgi:hypothetical protein